MDSGSGRTRSLRGWSLNDLWVQHCGVVCDVSEALIFLHIMLFDKLSKSPLNQGAYPAVPDQSAGTDTAFL